MAASESDVESHVADDAVSRTWQESNSISPVAVLTRNSFGFPLGGSRLPCEQRSRYGCVSFFFWGVFVFIPISYESPTGAAPLSLSDLWVADVKPLSPCPLSQLLRVTLLRMKCLLTCKTIQYAIHFKKNKA